ncbi:hypothetical protein [Microbacterium istanbulense]|uniref:Uncharacterized protein n=1 Tax=Microbacterium istanbulense TaxID=3122049 RepID=A0ABU8LLI2_9MICO
MTTVTAEATKTCPHCTRDLPVSAFALRKRGGESRQAWCRDCINVTRREAYARRNR